MEDKLKIFIQKKIDDARHYSENIHDVCIYRSLAFGAFLFLQNNNMVDYKKIGKWWDDYAWVQFKLIEKQFPY